MSTTTNATTRLRNDAALTYFPNEKSQGGLRPQPNSIKRFNHETHEIHETRNGIHLQYQSTIGNRSMTRLLIAIEGFRVFIFRAFRVFRGRNSSLRSSPKIFAEKQDLKCYVAQKKGTGSPDSIGTVPVPSDCDRKSHSVLLPSQFSSLDLQTTIPFLFRSQFWSFHQTPLWEKRLWSAL